MCGSGTVRLEPAAEFARKIGINRNTMKSWYRLHPDLFVCRSGKYFIKLEALAGLPGIDLVEALLLSQARWIRAVDLAAALGLSRRTVAAWCKRQPRFAQRIGRIWYVNPEQFGGSEEEVAEIWRRYEAWKGIRSTSNQ